MTRIASEGDDVLHKIVEQMLGCINLDEDANLVAALMTDAAMEQTRAPLPTNLPLAATLDQEE